MKKLLRFFVATVLGCTICTSGIAADASVVALADAAGDTEQKTAMGFLINDENLPVGWYSFPLTSAASPQQIKTTDAVSAGAMARNVYYAQTYTPGPVAKAWNTVDVATGELTQLAACGEDALLYVDMTYDYSTRKLWGISHYGGTSTKLCEINVADGTPVSTIDVEDLWLMTLACSYEGDMYSVGNDGYLYKLNRETSRFEKLGFMEYDIEYMQSMEFDHSTGVIYWACCTTYGGYWYKIDPVAVEASYISVLGVDGEMTGLHIPFSLAAPEAPADVTELTVNNPAHNTAVSFHLVLPTEMAGGGALTSITAVTVECDGAVLKTWTAQDVALAPGGNIRLDAEVAEGFHTFKVYAVNEAGNGMPATVRAFIGEDVPASPANVAVTTEGNSATITWSPVETGAQGGYIDRTTLSYSVVRQPGNVALAADLTQTTYTDNVDVMGVYRYEIVAKSAKGASEKAVSNPTAVGTYLDVPYVSGFESDDELLLWTINNANNDDLTWKRVESFDNGKYMRIGSGKKAADDWLISPPLRLEAGKSYKLIYNDWCANPDYPATYTVTIGSGNTPEAQQTVVKSVTADWFTPRKNFVYLSEIAETGTYYIGIHANWEAGYNTLYVSEYSVEENTAATLTATVTDGAGPLAGALVEFGAEKTRYVSDENGRVEIIEIEAGTYPVAISLFGYESQTLNLTFARLENKQITIPMVEVAKGVVTGRVLGKDGRGLEGASVYVHGYAEYNVVTDRDGNYSINDVYRSGEYTLDVHALNYESASVNVGEIAESNPMQDITLKEKLIAPENVAGAADREKVALTWDAPVDRTTTFRYDDGTDNYVFSMELSDITKYTAVGVVYDSPAVFTSMQWNVWNSSNNGVDVDVIVFDLDEEGRPTNRILYEENGLESRNGAWLECVFRHPVIAPRGALFTLRGDARLCMDGSAEGEVPFMADKMVYTHDYRTEAFTSRLPGEDTYAFRGNLTLRAEGLPYGAPRMAAVKRADAVPAAPDAKYDVFRLAEGDEKSADKWTKLTTTPIADCTYTDADWTNVAKGRYLYAVKAVYSDGCSSYAAFSAMVPRLLTSDVTLTVTTNTPDETAEGAGVMLVGVGNSNSYTGEVSADGIAKFTGVWEGKYKLTCTKKGYAVIEKEIDVSGAADFADNLALVETIQAPANLLVEETEIPTERLLRWNVVEGIFEDFEGHEDWTINSPGEIGWSYIDGDDCTTYASPNYEFPNMREKMAFIVMNPSKTDGSMVDADFMNAHSGERVIAGYATSNGSANNDFVISPELNMPLDFVVSFWARCYYNRYPETMRVGYSVTGNGADDFEWVGEPITVDNEQWKRFVVNIPAGAKYVALNYISEDKYYLAIDDIFIGSADKVPGVEAANAPARVAGSPVSYEVYLDDNMVTTTTETQYLLQNLTDGQHVAGVKSRFASGVTEMTTATFNIATSGIETVSAGAERIVVDGCRIEVTTTPGASVAVYGIDGRTVASSKTPDGTMQIELSAGVYIVKTSVSTAKVVLH